MLPTEPTDPPRRDSHTHFQHWSMHGTCDGVPAWLTSLLASTNGLLALDSLFHVHLLSSVHLHLSPTLTEVSHSSTSIATSLSLRYFTNGPANREHSPSETAVRGKEKIRKTGGLGKYPVKILHLLPDPPKLSHFACFYFRIK